MCMRIVQGYSSCCYSHKFLSWNSAFISMIHSLKTITGTVSWMIVDLTSRPRRIITRGPKIRGARAGMGPRILRLMWTRGPISSHIRPSVMQRTSTSSGLIIRFGSILLGHMWIMLGTYVNIELANPLTKRTLLVIG